MTSPAITRRRRRLPGSNPTQQPQDVQPRKLGVIRELLHGFDWDLSFVAFLYYCFAAFTSYLPGGDVAIVIALVLLVLRADTLRGHRFIGALILFVGWTGVTVLTSPFREVSWAACYDLIKVALISVIGFNVVRTRAHFRIALAFLGACFVFFPMRGAFVNYFGGYNMSGRALWNFSYANPNDLAAYAIIFFSMLLALFSMLHHRWSKLALMVASGLSVLLILFTQSRGALVAVGVAAVIGLVGHRIRLKSLLIAFGIVVVAAFFAPAGVWERLSGLTKVSVDAGMRGVDEENSAAQRFQIAKVAMSIAVDNSATGVGVGTYHMAHNRASARRANELRLATGSRDAHNTYLLLAAELGVPGLLLFLALLASAAFPNRLAMHALDTRSRAVVRVMRLGLVAFLLAGFFGSFGYLNILYVHLALMAVAPSVLAARSVTTVRKKRPL